jgi:hypothetical protein
MLCAPQSNICWNNILFQPNISIVWFRLKPGEIRFRCSFPYIWRFLGIYYHCFQLRFVVAGRNLVLQGMQISISPYIIWIIQREITPLIYSSSWRDFKWFKLLLFMKYMQTEICYAHHKITSAETILETSN